MDRVDFDEAMEMLINCPKDFEARWAQDSNIRKLRGLNDESLLHFLAVEQEAEAVQRLASLGCDVDQKNCFGETALIGCVSLNNSKMVQILLALGANPNVGDDKGDTALHTAYEYQVDSEIKDLLIHSGADPTVKNSFGQIPEEV